MPLLGRVLKSILPVLWLFRLQMVTSRTKVSSVFCLHSTSISTNTVI